MNVNALNKLVTILYLKTKSKRAPGESKWHGDDEIKWRRETFKEGEENC